MSSRDNSYSSTNGEIVRSLDAIKARAEAATDGPWINVMGEIGVSGVFIADTYTDGLSQPDRDTVADGEFIAHARNDIPALVAAVEAVLELHKPYITRSAWQTCNECWNSGTAEIVYPCPTVTAIREALGESE